MRLGRAATTNGAPDWSSALRRGGGGIPVNANPGVVAWRAPTVLSAFRRQHLLQQFVQALEHGAWSDMVFANRVILVEYAAAGQSLNPNSETFRLARWQGFFQPPCKRTLVADATNLYVTKHNQSLRGYGYGPISKPPSFFVQRPAKARAQPGAAWRTLWTGAWRCLR